MRRNSIKGFTLAEVLITLTVIGVIAALTIPSLITSIQDAQYHTAWKSAYSDLNQATNRLKLDNGGTLNGVFQNIGDMYSKYSPYFSASKKCPGGGCWHNANEWYNLYGQAINWGGTAASSILSNGNLLMFIFYATDCSDTSQSGNTMPICGYFYVDVNGINKPNTIGKDIYLIWITQNGLSPAGYNDNRVGTCDSSSGYGCAAQYLRQ